MVIVRIWEGLGNQLFQYAYARILQERLNEDVYLDIRHNSRGDLPYEKDDHTTREIELQYFNVTMKLIKSNKIKSLRCLDSKCLININFQLLKHNFSKWHFIEDKNDVSLYLDDLYTPLNYSYISAHFMNKKYFQEHRELLLNELTLKRIPKISPTLSQIIKSSVTVAVHIRLTDYLLMSNAVCKQQYYSNAFRFFEKWLDNPAFIIFTDDPQKAKEMYKIPENSYWVCEEHLHDYEELWLMTQCNHNIIAASTFSYWGAWLNRHSDKIVVAPRKWYVSSLYEKGWRTF